VVLNARNMCTFIVCYLCVNPSVLSLYVLLQNHIFTIKILRVKHYFVTLLSSEAGLQSVRCSGHFFGSVCLHVSVGPDLACPSSNLNSWLTEFHHTCYSYKG